MTTWSQVSAPPGGAIRGLGPHEGAVVARTSDGLFASRDRGVTWAALAIDGLGATCLPSGRLVLARVTAPPAPPDPADLVETMAFAIAPDGARWVGVRRSGLRFYAAPGPGGMEMMHPAYPVEEHVEVDGQVVRDGLAARDFAFDARGRVWVAATQSLEVLDGGAWRTALKRAASCVAIAADGTIVVGTPTAGFRSTDGETFTNVPRRATEQGDWGSLDLDAEDLKQIERAPDGTLWGRIFDGALVWAANRWQSRNLGLAMIPRKGTRDVRVTALAIVDGQLYAGTSGDGVFRRSL